MLSKQEVDYSPGHHQDRCGYCLYFRRQRFACELVEGYIQPEYWCIRFRHAQQTNKPAQ